MKGYGYVMDYSMKMVKEIYKSQVYCVKNKTFINFALEKKGDTPIIKERCNYLQNIGSGEIVRG